MKIIYHPLIYIPDLNPIEPCFHQFEAALERNYRQYGHSRMEIAHLQTMEAVTNASMHNFYRSVGGSNGVEKKDDVADSLSPSSPASLRKGNIPLSC